jgi:hypothetical protein
MKYTDEQIKVFQNLWKKHFGEEINKENAINYGSKVVRFVEVILKEKAKLLSENNYKN